MTDRSRLEILEDKLTLQILLVIRDNPHSTRSRICELSPGAKQTTLKRLVHAGKEKLNRKNRPFNARAYAPA